MGIMRQLLPGNQHQMDDYVEVDVQRSESVDEKENQGPSIHLAEVHGQSSVIDIKEKLYDGNIIIADIRPLKRVSRGHQHILDDLEQAAKQTGGDIIQYRDDHIVIAPRGMDISRSKIKPQ